MLDEVQFRISQEGCAESTDSKILSQVNNDLNNLLCVLSNTVFERLCKIHVRNYFYRTLLVVRKLDGNGSK